LQSIGQFPPLRAVQADAFDFTVALSAKTQTRGVHRRWGLRHFFFYLDGFSRTGLLTGAAELQPSILMLALSSTIVIRPKGRRIRSCRSRTFFFIKF